MRRKLPLVLCLIVAVLAVSVLCPAAYAATATGWGKQVRGTGPGNDAKLSSEPLIIPSGTTANITSVTCSGDGFWIEGTVQRNFYNANDAVGLTLGSGQYYVYPNLKPNQSTATVQIVAAW